MTRLPYRQRRARRQRREAIARGFKGVAVGMLFAAVIASCGYALYEIEVYQAQQNCSDYGWFHCTPREG